MIENPLIFSSIRVAIPVALIGLILVMCTSGCASTPSPPAESDGVGPVTPTSSAPIWRPKQPAPKIILSDTEMEQRRIAALDDERESYQLPPMEYPARIRWIYPEEQAAALVPCLTGKGFSVSANSAGTGVKGQVPSAQNQPFARAMIECEAQFSIDPRMMLPPTPQQYVVQYEYWSEFVIPCVRKHGAEIASLPSRPVWLADPQPLEGYPDGNATIQRECPYNIPSRVWLGEA